MTHAGSDDEGFILPIPLGYAPVPKVRWTAGQDIDYAGNSIRTLRDLWVIKKPAGDRLPCLTFFDALELRAWDDYLSIVDLTGTSDGMRRFRYRRIGANAVAVEGGDHAGKDMHTVLSPPHAAMNLGLYNQTLDSRAPVVLSKSIDLIGGGRAQWDRLALPFARDGETADHLAILTYIERFE